ncbi:MAG: NFACT family protein, partial [Firmicutes bacterium]|nr:NFACT family protein [Bacillota bacterium]
MAFDGIMIRSIIHELNDKILGGRIDKVYQPESDEIILGIRSFGTGYKLLLTANPSHPRLQLTEKSRENPAEPPLFCMVLRKHIQSGKILEITQPSFERIVNIKIEALNEMGDYTIKTLILEIMGRHSNLILIDENNTILECARHVSFDKSSVRQVLPGKEYVLPPSQDKTDTLTLNEDNFNAVLASKQSDKVFAAIYKGYTGISPVIADEICHNADVDSAKPAGTLTDDEKSRVYKAFCGIAAKIKNNEFKPQMIINGDKIVDFVPFDMNIFKLLEKRVFDTPSQLTEEYYATRDLVYRMNQKTHDLRRLITQNIERCVKKRAIQQKDLRETENREHLKLCGELITANIYAIKQGMTTVKLQNYYSEEQELVEVALDGALTPAENAQRYFKRYNKAKRTLAALEEQIAANDEELDYLETVLNSVNNCENEQDIKEIRRELREQGYIKKDGSSKKDKRQSKKSAPLHFVSSDG